MCLSVQLSEIMPKWQFSALIFMNESHIEYSPCTSSCTHPRHTLQSCTVYPKKYAHGFCFAVLCCGYTLTDFPISIRHTSLALWQSNDCPSASKASLMNMDKYFMWIHYERLRNHNKAKHNKTVCIFLGIYCISAHKGLTRIDRVLLLGLRVGLKSIKNKSKQVTVSKEMH